MSELRDHFDVSRETEARLQLFADLIATWTRKINLISPTTVDNIWERHILDSAQFWPAAPADATTWADLGSGAGFPGIVVAAIAAQHGSQLHVHLVESDNRKAVFLRTAQRVLGLRNTTVHAQRIESLAALNTDVVSARALAPLPRLLPMVARHLRLDGTALLAKGETSAQEVEATRSTWRFDLDELPSRTNPSARLLRLERIQRADT